MMNYNYRIKYNCNMTCSYVTQFGIKNRRMILGHFAFYVNKNFPTQTLLSRDSLEMTKGDQKD